MLKKAPFSASRLSRCWPSVDSEVALDMEPAVFTHVLPYLGHGVLPNFYDQVHGFNHGLYCLVLAQADYLLIERLSIIMDPGETLSSPRKKGTLCHDVCRRCWRYQRLRLDDTEYQYQLVWGKKRTYFCPRGIFIHITPSDCGRQCNNARGEDPLYRDRDELQIFELKTKTVFDSHVSPQGRPITALNWE